jgi:uncharacterized protein (TIGR02246 family)
MKKLTISAFLIFLLFHLQNKVTAQAVIGDQKKTERKTTTEQSEIKQLIFSYRDALNRSDVWKVLSLYTKDGVFMPTNAPTAKGQAQLKAAYEYVFRTLQINIEFSIEEIVVNSDYAYALTNSKGSALIHANGQTIKEENRELFVLQKDNSNQWKIACYMFNKPK